MSEADPAKAFDDLRAEVSVLRRAVEMLPDYSLDLGRIMKELQQNRQHLAAIEAHPTLKLQPDSYRQSVEQASLASCQKMAEAFQKEIGRVQVECQRLSGIIGVAKTKPQQRQWLLWCSLVCLIVGLVACPVIASFLPSGVGVRVASFIVGGSDPWDSGRIMMKIGNPDEWQSLERDEKIIENNRK